MPVPIRDASTVLALRDDAREGLEVFMVRRNLRLTFHGGAYVFPGGAVDDADASPSFDDLLDGFECAGVLERLHLSDCSRARAHYVAAMRELFEEAGILLARHASGAWIELTGDGDEAARFAEHRARVAAGDAAFEEMLRDEGLRLLAGRLRYFAHFVTPEHEKKRFDTRFFLALMPAGQSARHDEGETTEGQWIAPKNALASYARREIQLPPPTIHCLDKLSRCADTAEAMALAAVSDVVEIRPKVSVVEDSVILLLPDDDDYDSGVAAPASPGRTLHRLVLRDGLWVKP
jgi:8-oxo-dGTP pyrophosphatase MutT (NUDIX family)